LQQEEFAVYERDICWIIRTKKRNIIIFPFRSRTGRSEWLIQCTFMFNWHDSAKYGSSNNSNAESNPYHAFDLYPLKIILLIV
jgi:hypothetical protein